MNHLLKSYHLSRLKRRCRDHDLPQEIGDYLDCAAKNPKRRAAWKSLRFVVIDTETTGLDPRQDQVLAFGAVTVQQRRIRLADSLELLVHADTVGRNEQVPLHGILPQESQRGVPALIAVAKILDFIGASVLVGHHLAFDVLMIEKMIGDRLPGFFLHNPRLDTAGLAQRLIYPHRPADHIRPGDFALDALIARYRLTGCDRHTAHGDAMITAELLLHLLGEAAKRGRTRLGDICV